MSTFFNSYSQIRTHVLLKKDSNQINIDGVFNNREVEDSKVVDITEKNPGQFLVKSEVTMEIKGTDKPACIAETLSMWVT